MKKTALPKPTTIKLSLTKETIRTLPENKLHEVAGGARHTNYVSCKLCHTC